MRRIASAVCVGLVVVGITLWLRAPASAGPDAAPDSDAQPAQSQSSTAAPSDAEAASASVERSLVAKAEIRIVDATSGELVEAATVTPAGGVAPTLYPDPSLQRLERPGPFPLDLLGDTHAWLVAAPGYCATILEQPVRAGEVRLQRAQPLVLYLRDEDGGSVHQAKAWLTPAGVRHQPDVASWHGSGCGDPRSPTPVWAKQSDASGRIAFDDVPGGAFRLQVRHHESFPQNDEARGQGSVQAPNQLALTMLSLYGVVCEAPNGRTILQHSWSLPDTIDRHYAILQSRGEALRALQTTFPKALVYVGRPRPDKIGSDVLIRVNAMLDGNTKAHAQGPLQKLRDIAHPICLSPTDEVLFRSVHCTILSKGGHPMPMALRWQPLDTSDDDRAPPRFSKAGEPCLLPPGRYTVWPQAVPPWVSAALDNNLISIADTDPTEVHTTVQLTASLRQLLITPKLPGEGEGPVHVLVQARGQNYGVMNWEPAQGPIECLCPTGEVKLSVQGKYTIDPRKLEVFEGLEPLEVALTLRERQ